MLPPNEEKKKKKRNENSLHSPKFPILFYMCIFIFVVDFHYSKFKEINKYVK